MKHKRRISWMLSICMLILTVMASGIDVGAVDFDQESIQATEDSSLEKTENEATKETEDITGEFTNSGEPNTAEFEVREDETITSMDEEGNVSEAPDESGLLEIDLLSNDGKIVNFNTKGAVVTTYTEVGTGNAGYTCGAYGADAAYLGTENGKVKFLLSGVTGLVDANDVQVVSVNSASSVSYYAVSAGRLIHNITTNITQGNYITSLDNGPAPSYLSEGVQYYSYDGHYFYTRDRFSNMLDDYKAGVRTNSINSSSPYYNYYQYLPLRSKTVYSAAQLNEIINSKAAGYKMSNTGDMFKNYQNTYGVNALIVVGIAANESAWGKSSIAQEKNNLFGLNAVDAAPGQSANAYESIDACIKTFTETYMSKRYLNPKNWVYSGGYLGNKGSGMNVRYASDPYWGEKNANVAWMIDKIYGNKDSNRYTIGIKDVIGNEHTDLNVRTEANGSSTVIHTTKNYSNQAFIILDSSQGNFYKVQSDAALTTNRTTVSDAGNYDFSSMYAYVSSGYVKKILTGSGNSGGSGESGGNENKPDNSLGSGAIAVPTELAGAIEYSAHVREIGWMDCAKNGQMMGTTGKNLPMEAMKINISGVANLGVEYQVHAQDIGWMDSVSNGEVGGTVGQAKNLEAIKLKLTGDAASNYDLYYRVHVTNIGWMDWAKNGELAGTQGYNYALQAVQIALLPKGSAAPGGTETPYQINTVKIGYSAHVQDVGWQNEVLGSKIAGTTGQNKKIEAMILNVKSNLLGVKYRSYLQDTGWQNYHKDGEIAGTTGQNRRMEAIEIELTGNQKDNYDIYYRVHVQDLGWLGWAKNGETAGTMNYALKVEAIQMLIVPKGTPTIENEQSSFKKKSTNIEYSTHVQDIGWQDAVQNGELAGTTGQNKQVEAIRINLQYPEYSGEIKYKSHIQDIGWQNYVSNGAISGTVGRNKEMEAICIELTGEMAEKYDVYYQVHSNEFGWLGWAKNGEKAGSEGYARQVEAIRIQLVEKGGKAPEDIGKAFYKK